jgi:hypothetical protein
VKTGLIISNELEAVPLNIGVNLASSGVHVEKGGHITALRSVEGIDQPHVPSIEKASNYSRLTARQTPRDARTPKRWPISWKGVLV